MKAKLYDFGLHRHKDEYKYSGIGMDKKERLRLIQNGGFVEGKPGQKVKLDSDLWIFVCHTVDGSEIPFPTTWVGAKILKIMGSTTNLNWWVYRISEAPTICTLNLHQHGIQVSS